MTRWLAFQLYGAMASFGDVAVGEFRPTWGHPTRSAVIGLLSAALGIRREAEEELQAMSKGYRLSFRVDREGVPIRDYHTTQVPSSGSGRNTRVFYTRKEELSADKDQISTILSTRDYLCDSGFTVFVTALSDAPYTLEELQQALKNPVFVLYLGRKSCPLSLPVHPVIIEADTLKDACKQVLPARYEGRKPNYQHDHRVFWEEGVEAGTGDELEEVHFQVRRDELLSRKRWQFSTRDEYFGVLHCAGGD